ncbi:protein kinase domain-containing protein [Sphingomonas sp. DT-51]|uniref:serine/threonine-protein kinase n=1 Tax=Sphingomonas sp. DT-51 TaxID=3396165 RepID=UPI003F1A8C5D
MPPRRDGALVPGDLLNGIYKVERFIARGGMGEVFEGVNVESDERVAIKAIRSHLASDPKIVALFRKEARVLTQIAHPAIVHYRVFARDPVLDLHYIVTDFINGEPITFHLDGERPTVRAVVTLAHRLAAGIEAAHDHGAIHRDMSPDNVLLPDGRIERAKIIDFGIAKSLDFAAETVVGEGFAGKLGYVAPEQFGAFGREIGPWTDIYSTALVLLAYARGRAPAMGTTLSEAVERRRDGADLTDIPPSLEPLLRRMLAPDPSQRIRSMREVIVALDAIRLDDDAPVTLRAASKAPDKPGPAVPSVPPLVTTPSARPVLAETTQLATIDSTPPPSRRGDRTDPPPRQRAATTKPACVATKIARPRPGRRKWLYIAMPMLGGLGVIGYALHRAPSLPPVPHAAPARPPVATTGGAASSLSAADRASRVAAMLEDMPCTWASARPTREDGPVALSGGAGSLDAVHRRLDAGATITGRVDMTELRWVNVTQCGTVDALRPFRTAGLEKATGLLELSALDLPLGTGGRNCVGGATADIAVPDLDPGSEFAIVVLQPDGRLLQIAGSRVEFDKRARQTPEAFNVGADGARHAALCFTQQGAAAVFLLRSRGAIDLGLQTGVPALPPGDFATRVADQGGSQQMRVYAEWVRIARPPASGKAVPAVPVRPIAADGSLRPARPTKLTVPFAGLKPGSEDLPALAAERARAAADSAQANRRELARIEALRGSGNDNDDAMCQAFSGRWQNVSASSRHTCIARAMIGRCSVSSVMFKKRLFRRAGGHIQEQRGSRWRDVATDGGC